MYGPVADLIGAALSNHGYLKLAVGLLLKVAGRTLDAFLVLARFETSLTGKERLHAFARSWSLSSCAIVVIASRAGNVLNYVCTSSCRQNLDEAYVVYSNTLLK